MQIVKNTTILFEPKLVNCRLAISIIQKKEELTCVNSSLQFIQLCDSGRIQTCNLLIRSQMLYSVELRSQKLLKRCFLKADAKVRNIFESTKFILYFLKTFLLYNLSG